MKVTGKMIRGMAQAMNAFTMEIYMQENMSMDVLMAKESSLGLMEKSTMANGEKDSRKDMASGEALKMTHISDNGKKAKQMDMEFISGKMEIGMKESGDLVLGMETALTSSIMETNT